MKMKLRYYFLFIILTISISLMGCDFFNEETTTTGDNITTDTVISTTDSSTDTSTSTAVSSTENTTTSFVTTTEDMTTTVSSTTTETTTNEPVYVLSFDTQGLFEMDSISFTQNQSILLDAIDEFGYIFYGWYANPDFTGDTITEIQVGTSENVTVYAKLLDLSAFFLNNTENILVFPNTILEIDEDGTRIQSNELYNLYNAFVSLGLNVDNIEFFTVLDALTIESIKEVSNITDILKSEVMKATLSTMIINIFDQIGGVPKYAYEGFVLRHVDETDLIEYIDILELYRILEVIQTISFDLNTISISVDTFTKDEIEIMMTSSILHHIISSFLFETMDDSDIFIPNLSLSSNPVIITFGSGDDLTRYISSEEISAVLDAMEYFDTSDITSIINHMDISLLVQALDTNILFDSSILHASISMFLVNMEKQGLILIPPMDTSLNQIMWTFGDGEQQYQYISRNAIEKLIRAIDILGVTELSQYSGCFDLISFSNVASMNTILDSAIMHATVSTIILDMEASNLLEVPLKSADDNDLIITVSLGDNSFDYISIEEIALLIEAMLIYQMTDLQSYDFELHFSMLSEEELNSILDSSIMHSVISRIIIEHFSETDYTRFVPYLFISTRQGYSGNLAFLEKQDIIDFYNVSKALNIEYDYFGNIVLSEFKNLSSSDLETVLASKIVKAYITPQIEDFADELNYTLTNMDYLEHNTDFALTDETILYILDLYFPEPESLTIIMPDNDVLTDTYFQSEREELCG